MWWQHSGDEDEYGNITALHRIGVCRFIRYLSAGESCFKDQLLLKN